MDAKKDEDFMTKALEAARDVRGNTGDNPPVGCVVVVDGQIAGIGATQPAGGAHAEVMAIQSAKAAGHDPAHADIYVTLEPCTFTGRTPPCTAMLVALKPKRVVVGIRDPHPLVNGKGIRALREAGIEVTEGVLAEPISDFLAEWVRRFTQNT